MLSIDEVEDQIWANFPKPLGESAHSFAWRSVTGKEPVVQEGGTLGGDSVRLAEEKEPLICAAVGPQISANQRNNVSANQRFLLRSRSLTANCTTTDCWSGW